MSVLVEADLQNIAKENRNCYGTVWHLSPHGSDSNDGLTAATARLTIAGLSLSNGDTVVMARGSYTFSSTPELGTDVEIIGDPAGGTIITVTTGNYFAVVNGGSLALKDLTILAALCCVVLNGNFGTFTAKNCILYATGTTGQSAIEVLGNRTGNVYLYDSYVQASNCCISSAGNGRASLTGTYHFERCTFVGFNQWNTVDVTAPGEFATYGGNVCNLTMIDCDCWGFAPWHDGIQLGRLRHCGHRHCHQLSVRRKHRRQ